VSKFCGAILFCDAALSVMPFVAFDDCAQGNCPTMGVHSTLKRTIGEGSPLTAVRPELRSHEGITGVFSQGNGEKWGALDPISANSG